MPKQSIIIAIKKLHRPIFTTHELSMLSGSSLSSVSQSLSLLCKKGIIIKINRGLWAAAEDERVSPYIVIPFLFSKHRAYLSFISALHLYGIIEQIPQVITLASIVHTKIIRTKLGVFSVHQIAPSFFKGFDWYRGTGRFLIAKQEKALVDSLYLSARKKRQFGYFPELHFPKSFSFTKAKEYAGMISDVKIASCVQEKLEKIREKRSSVKFSAR